MRDDMHRRMPYRDAVAALEIKLRGLREARRELDLSIEETRRELRHRRRGRRGTWLEVLVAVVVLASAALVGLIGLATTCACPSRVDTTYTAVQTIKGAAELYVARAGECPTVEDLVDRGILNADQAVVDSWEQPFRIKCGRSRVCVSSAGPDGMHGTCDDIVSWQRPGHGC